MSELMTYDEAVRDGRGIDNTDTAIPLFYNNAVKRVAKSEELGREFFEDVPFVRIILPGLRGEEIDRKASDEDKERWPAQWEAFQNKQEQPLSGTPLEACSLINPSDVATLKVQKILTVDAFVNIPDHALGKLGPGFDALRDKCKRWIQGASDGDELRGIILELRNDVSKLKKEIEKLEKERDRMVAERNGIPHKKRKSKKVKKDDEEGTTV
jgi:hypothetical protein